MKDRILEAFEEKIHIYIDMTEKDVEEMIFRCASAKESMAENKIPLVRFFIDSGLRKYGFLKPSDDQEENTSSQKPAPQGKKGKKK